MSAKVCAPAWSENGKRDSQRSSFIHVNAELHVVPCERASGENAFLIRILDGTSFFFFYFFTYISFEYFFVVVACENEGTYYSFFPPEGAQTFTLDIIYFCYK